MKHNQADNFSFTDRALAKSRRYSIGILLITLIAVGLFTVQPATGQRKPSQGYEKEMEIPAGFDAFKTVAGTRFTFRQEFAIPANFFDKGSRPFAGIVSFKGIPIGSFRDQKTGLTDTIVERKKGATFDRTNARTTVPIEVLALSLESARPIRVQVGRASQLWSVKTELSRSRKSDGTMTIMRRSEKGGTFSSEFVVFPLMTFTRQSDGQVRTLDVGAMKLDRRSVDKITFRTTGAPWVQGCGSSDSDFCPGLAFRKSTGVIIHEFGVDVEHFITIVVIRNDIR